ncbi:MAG TPA: hypothetical protein VFP81_02410 [Propionibacteriaceae bacterium]|nr:hypothetical protein [Propionibacteriaceae bacterium]
MAVASAVVGLVLVGDTNPALWTYGYWPVLELMWQPSRSQSVARSCLALRSGCGP